MIAPEEPEVKERILFDYPDRFISRVISKTQPYPSTPNLMSAKISIKTLGAQFAPPTLRPGYGSGLRILFFLPLDSPLHNAIFQPVCGHGPHLVDLSFGLRLRGRRPRLWRLCPLGRFRWFLDLGGDPNHFLAHWSRQGGDGLRRLDGDLVLGLCRRRRRRCFWGLRSYPKDLLPTPPCGTGEELRIIDWRCCR